METKTCSNCRKEINTANFLMHENFCLKNIRPCEICKVPIDKNQKDEHFLEFHAKETCECGQQIEKQYFEAHKKDNCPKRKAQCIYCELILNQEKLDEHLNFCGSRTELCELCNRYIKKKDKKSHDETDCQYPKTTLNRNLVGQTSLSHAHFDNLTPFVNRENAGFHDADFLYNDNIDDYLNNFVNEFTSPRSKPRSEPSPDTLIPCEFCDEIISLFELHTHQVTCSKNPDNLADSMRTLTSNPNNLNLNQNNNNISSQLPTERETIARRRTLAKTELCHYCDRLYDSDLLSLHQEFCKEKRDYDERQNSRSARPVSAAKQSSIKPNTEIKTNISSSGVKPLYVPNATKTSNTTNLVNQPKRVARDVSSPQVPRHHRSELLTESKPSSRLNNVSSLSRHERRPVVVSHINETTNGAVNGSVLKNNVKVVRRTNNMHNIPKKP